MVKRCYHCGYKLTSNITYSLYNTAIGKVVTVCKDCHTSHLRMRAKQRKKGRYQLQLVTPIVKLTNFSITQGDFKHE